MNEYIDLASEVGVSVPHVYSCVKTSRVESKFGEKPVSSIIDKVNRNVLINGKLDYRILDIYDLIRATIIVDRYEHIPMLMDILKEVFPDMTGRLTMNKERGYKGPHIKTTRIDGLGADIHIETPQMAMANTIHHKLYEIIRNLPHGSDEREKLVNFGKKIYDMLWTGTDFLESDLLIRSKFLDYGDMTAKNDLSRIPESLVEMLKEPPYKIIKNQLVTNGKLTAQAEAAHDFAVEPQKKLNRLLDTVFHEYTSKQRNGYTEPHTTDKQAYLYLLFKLILDDKTDELKKQGASDPQLIFAQNHGANLAEIENIYIRPIIAKKKNWVGHLTSKDLKAHKDYKDFLRTQSI